MKRFSVFLAAVAMMLPAAAREPQRGYRGFVDWDNSITSYKIDEGQRETVWFTGGSTSHGFQFNPHFFLGGGLMIEGSNKLEMATLPLFVQVRTDQKWGQFTPFGDLRVGFNCCDGGGIYLSPTVGYRLNWGRKANLNLGIGLTLRGSTTDNYRMTFTEDFLGTGQSVLDIEYIGKSHHTKAMFTIRLGIDF